MEPFIGEIRMFAGNYAPQGWLLCQGQVIDISTNEVLYALLGTIYGGDGRTTFALPDLRGRLPVGQGQGVGLTARTIGQSMGVEDVTLTQAQIPSHSHTLFATSGTATTITPGPGTMLATVSNPQGFYNAGTANPPTKAAFSGQAVAVAGASLPHSNHMPTASINYIIAITGIYPSQN
ncbi:phage tail protein [Ralstonia solanacearum]|uniref:phage tail protein n=1 Tax=Ralstonia solanacearum TaxID=305 RepID=UPI0005AC93EC|nr:tail fiber protein [Ralstonia solanacearum]